MAGQLRGTPGETPLSRLVDREQASPRSASRAGQKVLEVFDMTAAKTIGFIFIPRFADWEYGLLAASAVEWFGAKAVALSPDADTVTGSAGFRLTPDRGIDPDANGDLAAVAVIGSDEWTAEKSTGRSAPASVGRGAWRRCRRNLRRYPGARACRLARRPEAHEQRPRLDTGKRARLCWIGALRGRSARRRRQSSGDRARVRAWNLCQDVSGGPLSGPAGATHGDGRDLRQRIQRGDASLLTLS